MRIYKYPLEIVGAQIISMHDGARILSVHEQRGRLCLWAIVDPNAPARECRITIAGTGHPPPPDPQGKYVGTVVMSDGFVWHVFAEES